MQQIAQLSRQVDWLLACGFDPVRAHRLTFVRWSMLEGYAQFSEFVTSDDPVVEIRPGFETGEQGSLTDGARKEERTA